ncbi:hypothetical protein TNCV_2825231 [Trichonephila clavipes]|nr:hypothetical protein TNCV_2825231 [Trichonephila clavipes]
MYYGRRKDLLATFDRKVMGNIFGVVLDNNNKLKDLVYREYIRKTDLVARRHTVFTLANTTLQRHSISVRSAQACPDMQSRNLEHLPLLIFANTAVDVPK